jgi:hypothetical protein
MPTRFLPILTSLFTLTGCAPPETGFTDVWRETDALNSAEQDIFELCPLPPDSALPIDFSTGEVSQVFQSARDVFIQVNEEPHWSPFREADSGSRRAGFSYTNYETEHQTTVTAAKSLFAPQWVKTETGEGNPMIDCKYQESFDPEERPIQFSVRIANYLYNPNTETRDAVNSLTLDILFEGQETTDPYYQVWASSVPEAESYFSTGSLDANSELAGLSDLGTSDVALSNWMENTHDEMVQSVENTCPELTIDEPRPGDTFVRVEHRQCLKSY